MLHPSRRMLLPALVAGIAAFAHAGTLKVGDPAPPLPVAAWFKGKPVTAFEPGRMYVVEFWATWCGPCRTSIPHLTELARKFAGKVDFVGISILEKKAGPADKGYLKGVEAFVKEQGDKMVYHVGADGPAGTIADTWFKPSGSPGIPTAILVNGQGRIHWIGHPMELDPVLDAVVAGTFDARAAAAKREAETERRARDEKAIQPFFAAMRKGDYAEAARVGAELFPTHPSVEMSFGHVYYSALAHTDPARADAYARALAAGPFKDSAPGLAMLAGTMLENSAQEAGLIVKVADQALLAAKSQDDPYFLDMSAQAHARAGDFKVAAEREARALATGKVPEPQREAVTARLKSYQSHGSPAKG
ncbi:TlpA family protein disulfide reductase [Mesoterricola silvestris]|uniref:Thioredoxin domain-containing protein n=1 Tax=Mesoterricola silvestris TaxID=2927979 RepID=A0AA48GXG0_9BACT|nr:TlpA disulfide reductase family protein [Mesoterricola silvestris]BDU72133.1 hypothetical protein METEAL_13070 [Mesoterricola silvestris]